jgi:hypothetical protein
MELYLHKIEKQSDLPIRYTAHGQNVSPALSWDKVAGLAKSLAVICEDMDSEPSGFNHWLIYNIPTTECELCENIADDETLENGTRQGINDEGAIGYTGPGQKGRHYKFRLLALNHIIDNVCVMDKEEFFNVTKGHIIDQAEVMVTFNTPENI